jgi:hypothetical protein
MQLDFLVVKIFIIISHAFPILSTFFNNNAFKTFLNGLKPFFYLTIGSQKSLDLILFRLSQDPDLIPHITNLQYHEISIESM